MTTGQATVVRIANFNFGLDLFDIGLLVGDVESSVVDVVPIGEDGPSAQALVDGFKFS